MKNRVMRTDYPIRKIVDDTYMISDFGIANCYLLIGEERALLIDCGPVSYTHLTLPTT